MQADLQKKDSAGILKNSFANKLTYVPPALLALTGTHERQSDFVRSCPGPQDSTLERLKKHFCFASVHAAVVCTRLHSVPVFPIRPASARYLRFLPLLWRTIQQEESPNSLCNQPAEDLPSSLSVADLQGSS